MAKNSKNEFKNIQNNKDKKQQKKKPKKDSQKLSPAEFFELNQVDWYPSDPYCD